MLPDSIPASIWDEFKAHRRKLKRPMTDYAETLILCKLEKWRVESGVNPIDILNESIEKGWTGVFLNGHANLSATTKTGQISQACKNCGSTTWVRLDRYKHCERCQ